KFAIRNHRGEHHARSAATVIRPRSPTITEGARDMANAISVPNPLKDLLKAGKVALGMNVRLARTGDIAGIARTSGHDFIFIDRQHSLFSVESIGNIAQGALACGITPLVRVRSCDDPDTAVLLDNGVMGIVFPDISTAAEARRAVGRAKFPPIGRRSVAGTY